ncbi:MAG TPA: phosphatase PAP2 family protein [Acidimicrobiales bacterium]|nr:phosphatase PAP2 family protein [Acidimicrobiales bacterium]
MGSSQRPRRQRVAAGGLACLAMASVMVACGDDGGSPMDAVVRAEPTAGTWQTWVLSSAGEIQVPAPPPRDSDQAKADLDAVKEAADRRTAGTRVVVDKWSGPLPTKPWTEVMFRAIEKSSKNPPLSSRNGALIHVAMYDAVLASYHWKYQYNVEAPEGVDTLVPASPDPSYPSEHAAIAGAAANVIAHLYPGEAALRLEEMAEEAAQSRVDAGTNTPSDVEAGLALGRAVADKVIAYAQTDGAGTPWNGRRPAGIGTGPRFWEPPPGTNAQPTDPEAAKWKAWVLASNNQFRPPPPPAYNSAQFRASAQKLVDIKKNLTEEQKRIAKFWEGAQGSVQPAGIALGVAMADVEKAAAEGDVASRWTVPRAARAMALLNITMADGGIAVWDAKYAYWYPRPVNGIRDSAIDRTWEPFVPTPFFPAYPSGSAGYAGGVEAVMNYLFPDNAAEHNRRAEEQALSRQYAGIHWDFDAVSIDGGRQISQLVIDKVKNDSVGGGRT